MKVQYGFQQKDKVLLITIFKNIWEKKKGHFESQKFQDIKLHKI